MMTTIVFGDFEWDARKAVINFNKHGVSFEEAASAVVDPHSVDAPDLDDPARVAIIGMSRQARVLFVVVCERRGERLRIITAREASKRHWRVYENRR
jgi:uncharacterized protein